jgi:hypothetical protein
MKRVQQSAYVLEPTMCLVFVFSNCSMISQIVIYAIISKSIFIYSGYTQ